jgi:hypothetical protein
VCLGQLVPSLFLWSTTRWGAWGMWQHRSSPLGEKRPGSCGSAGAHLDREARSGAEEHVAAPEPTSTGRRGLELRNVWWRRSSTQQEDEAWGHGPRGSTGAHLSKEVRSRAAGHVAAPKPTSAGRCGPKLQLTWQCVDTRPASCLDLELVCGGTWSSGCRQGPPGGAIVHTVGH